MSLKPRETCPLCGSEGRILWALEVNEPDGQNGCAECVREYAHRVVRIQLCDNDPNHGVAWRNPKTRRNEYLCARCHVESGDGVVQNKWAQYRDAMVPRTSNPLGVRDRPECEARNVPGTKACDGNVKPRGTTGALLCNAHAGKQSLRYSGEK